MAEIVDIIAKLGVDAKGVYSELDKVNAKYAETSSEIRKQKEELASLQKFEEGLMKERAKSNNPTIVAQFNKEIEKTQAQIKKLNEQINIQASSTQKLVKDNDKLKAGLDKAFDGTKIKALNKEIKGTDESAGKFGKKVVDDVGKKGEKAIETLKQRLIELKIQIAQATDPAEATRLAEEAGKVQNKIDDINKSVSIFASSSKFELLNKTFGEIGNKLLSFDFEGAQKYSEQLLNTTAKITFKDAIGGIKQIGTTLSNVGVALLTNPLFLIFGTIGAGIKIWDDLNTSIDAGTKSLEENAKALQKVQDETDALISLNRDLALENEIAAGRIKAIDGEKLKNQNKFKDAYKAILEEQLAAEKVFNESIEKEKEEDGFRRTKQLYEFFGGETEITKRQKIGLAQIESEFAEKIKALKAGFGLENDKILIGEANREAQLRRDRNKRAEEESRSQAKKLRDLEVANITDETERRRAELTTKFNDDFEAAKGNADIIRELNIKLANDLEAIEEDLIKKRKAILDKGVEDQKQANQEVIDEMLKDEEDRRAGLERALSEEQRHQTAMLEIRLQGNDDAGALLYANDLYWEKLKLAQIEEFYGKESEEYLKQANKIEEMTAKHNADLNKIDKKRTEEVINNLKTIVDATTDAVEKVIAEKIKELDRLSSLQQKRVDDAQKIAEKGNAELLELEKERLDKLTKERENYVRAQQTLASIELIANTAVTVSKAAAQGGAAAGVTIAAALIALVAGLATARSIAGQAAFYEGGEYDGQGYTGDGNPREVSNQVGRKPYIYHKREFIHNHQTTAKYRQIFQDVHDGKVDLNRMKFESDMYKMLNASGIDLSRDIHYKSSSSGASESLSELKGKLDDVRHAIERQESASFHVDERGIYAIYRKHLRDKKRIDNIAR